LSHECLFINMYICIHRLHYMRKTFFHCLADEPDLAISQIIKEKSAAQTDYSYAKDAS